MKRKLALFAVLTVLSGLAFYFSTTTPAQAAEHHPKIKHAIVALEEAKKELKGAAHDFGGHRADALKDCDAAIAQLKLALQYDKE
jgi:hypothetical protein